MTTSGLGTQLSNPPGDGITSLRFSPSDQLLASSWDGVSTPIALAFCLFFRLAATFHAPDLVVRQSGRGTRAIGSKNYKQCVLQSNSSSERQ